MFSELIIRNTPITKIRPFFVFMEEVQLPQSHVSLREGKTFHDKSLTKLYHNSERNFLHFLNCLSYLEKI